MNPSDVYTILAAVAVPLVAAATGVGAYLARRKSASGRVSDSEASILWQQSQDMRTMLMTEKERAEEQRDKLIAAYTEQVLPLLSSVNRVVQDLSVAVAEILPVVRGIRDDLEGGSHAATVAPRALAGAADDSPAP